MIWNQHYVPHEPDAKGIMRPVMRHEAGATGKARYPGMPTASNAKNKAMARTRRKASA